jgi:predicted PurR-regulated permease PerM
LGLTGALLLTVGGLILAFVLHGRTTHLPELLARMSQLLDGLRQQLGGRWIPEEFTTGDTVGTALASLMREHAEAIKAAGGHAGRLVAHVVAGSMVGLLAFFHQAGGAAPKPLAKALSERMAHLRSAFEAVVFAQARISALNTLLSALYLYLLLPLFGVQLPMRATLVVVTFAAGLLPVVGNLLSNSAVVLLSLSAGPKVALASLAYLVFIHKIEYVLNAKIVGSRIHSQAWEVLMSMVFLEVAFGLPGLVLAPVIYAYAKGELRERGLV